MTEIIGTVTWSREDLERACKNQRVELDEDQEKEVIKSAEFIAQNFLRHTFLEDAILTQLRQE